MIVTDHALGRISKQIGRCIGYEKALDIFNDAVHIKYDDLITMGYRPSVHKHTQKGHKSWYFISIIDDNEMVIVVTNCNISESLIWVTTYFPNRLSNNLKILDFDDLRMGK
ncbi:MAG: hypothetical protein GF411_14100 [Candidatus Lokiarchaeota archaeon]|nr:hypothetical protein [Candidatus Lokiarchaeota archaeon]